MQSITSPKSAHPHKRRKHRGGYKPSTGLNWQTDVKRIFEIVKLARERDTPLNVFFTLRTPSTLPDEKRKRWVTRKVAHLGQALGRKPRCQPKICITVYERKPDGQLHAHGLIYVVPGNDDVVAKWCKTIDASEGPNMVHARHAVKSDTVYITKQRHPFHPETEKDHWHRRQKGALIIGKRWTATAAARALLIEEHRQTTPPLHRQLLSCELGEAPEPSQGFVQNEPQWSLFLNKPVHRRRLGLSQYDLANLVSASQPTLANAVAGRFGLSAWLVNRLRKTLLTNANDNPHVNYARTAT